MLLRNRERSFEFHPRGRYARDALIDQLATNLQGPIRMMRAQIAFSLAATVILASSALADDARPIFDGRTLDGWVQHGGKAKYRVENGEIVGTSVPNTGNSFLCTARDYGDFVLE